MSTDIYHGWPLIWRWAIGLAFCVAVWWFSVVLMCCLIDSCKQKSSLAEPHIKARMKFHGTQVAFEDHRGNHWFVNKKGERCRL
jgi:hypothetical protein